ncbi:MAG: hypothetical protein ACNA8S_10775 [Deferrisomatales bacterium]
MVEIGREARLFHNQLRDPYATVERNGHTETWPIGSGGFLHWLEERYNQCHGGFPSQKTTDAAIHTLGRMACHSGPTIETHVRVAEHERRVYLDLCDKRWRVVEITAHGWRVLDTSPVKFVRTPTMATLPEPMRGGTLDALQDLLNLSTPEDDLLIRAWLLAALYPVGPCPVLVLNGEQGSGKSTTTRILVALVDPRNPALVSLPHSEGDLAIQAISRRILAFDNLSDFSEAISNALCRVVTGGGIAKRRLYTNADEVGLEVRRSIILNGIGTIVTRSDLLDRCIIILLPAIADRDRREEARVWDEFQEKQPLLLGALLDTLAQTLAERDHIELTAAPRMADFARLGEAAARTLGHPPGEFLRVYSQGGRENVHLLLETSPIGAALCRMKDLPWTGSATQLLAKLNAITDDATRRGYDWPKTPHKLAAALWRIAPPLRKIGIVVKKLPRATHTRMILVDRIEDSSSHLSQVSYEDAASVSRDGVTVPKAAHVLEDQDQACDDDGYDGYDDDAEAFVTSRHDLALTPEDPAPSATEDDGHLFPEDAEGGSGGRYDDGEEPPDEWYEWDDEEDPYADPN